MGADPIESQRFKRPRNQKPQEAGSAAEMLADLDPRTVQTLVVAAVTAGGAVRIGATRDGGAVAIGVYHGEVYFTDYVRPSESLEDYMRDLSASFDSAGKPDLRPKGNKRPK